MSMHRASRGVRLQIGLFGRRNAGKSSLLNRVADRECSIVSDTPGTTTDPVARSMEIQPLGPVMMVDTAGLDDTGQLGEQRVRRSRDVVERCDLTVLVVGPRGWSDLEDELLATLKVSSRPVLVVFSHADLWTPEPALVSSLTARGVATISAQLTDPAARVPLVKALVAACPDPRLESPPLLSDLIPSGGLAVLVTPIDPEAPKGRLILPQVQTIRDALDHDAMVLVTKERELRAALNALREPPNLVVTDSQAFLRVAGDVPSGVPLTSFSVLFARLKGDLDAYAAGARRIEELRPGDRVLIAESCAHHPTGEDIGTVKIPRWLEQYVGGGLSIDHVKGGFPSNVSDYRLVIQCGGCTKSRREIMSRIARCEANDVPVTNYGLCIAYTLGIFDRALQPFERP